MEVLALLLIVVLALFGAFKAHLNSPTAKGARGERRVNTKLKRRLPAKDYTIFHDVTLDSSQGSTQIDHIVLSRYGVFVIETKNYKGWIFGDSDARQWTHVLYRRKYRFQNPLRQNYKHVKAVESFLAIQTSRIHSVVVFVGDSKFKTSLPANVTDLRGFIPYVRSKQDRLLSERQVSSITQKFIEHMSGSSGAKQNEPHLKIVSSHPVCSRCGNEMVLRTARKGVSAGKQFWGCSLYPKCKFTKDVS